MMDRRVWLCMALATLGLGLDRGGERRAGVGFLAGPIFEPLRRKYTLPALAAAVVKTGVIVAAGVVVVRALVGKTGRRSATAFTSAPTPRR